MLRAHSVAELEGAFAPMTRAGPSGLLGRPPVHFTSARKRIVELAARPSAANDVRALDAGGLRAYGQNLPALFPRVA